MTYRSPSARRRGASAVEAAFVLPLTFLLFLLIVVGGMGIFVYQETAHIGRETARFASVHGAQYAQDNAAQITAGTLPSVNQAYLQEYAKSLAIAVDSSQLQVTVQMIVLTPGATSSTSTQAVGWDDVVQNQYRSAYSAWTNINTIPPTNVQLENLVIVTVSYPWSPGILGMGTYTLTSTSVYPMSH